MIFTILVNHRKSFDKNCTLLGVSSIGHITYILQCQMYSFATDKFHGRVVKFQLNANLLSGVSATTDHCLENLF
jgi:hypothetical protein